MFSLWHSLKKSLPKKKGEADEASSTDYLDGREETDEVCVEQPLLDQ
jgi:hypothetical protein